MFFDGVFFEVVEIEFIEQWICEGVVNDMFENIVMKIDMEYFFVYQVVFVIIFVDFSDDGKWLVVLGYYEVFIYDVMSFDLVKWFVGFLECIELVVFFVDS